MKTLCAGHKTAEEEDLSFTLRKLFKKSLMNTSEEGRTIYVSSPSSPTSLSRGGWEVGDLHFPQYSTKGHGNIAISLDS